MTQFTDLGLAEPLLRALTDEGYTTPTPIQAQAIPGVAAGRDLLGVAQTGTGKTAAFALPLLHRLHEMGGRPKRKSCRVLVLSPTRELASQIRDSFRAYGRHLSLTSAVVFGGVPINRQIRALQNGVDVLVATPGRLLDLTGQRALDLTGVEMFVLDEADQMLDMGFIQPIRQVVAQLPKRRQNLFFSATMPGDIAKLAGELLTDPLRVAVTPVASTAERVSQRAILVDGVDKRDLLTEVLNDVGFDRALIFSRTKHGADKIARNLTSDGLPAEAIHGNKSQGQRERTLGAFRQGRVRVLVATDIAARGIDVDGISHVVNYDLPNVPESYVHRIGRTARAGANGEAISFCNAEERAYLKDIEKLIRQEIPAEDRRRGNEPEFMPRPKQGRGNGKSQRSPRPANNDTGWNKGPRAGKARSRPAQSNSRGNGRSAGKPSGDGGRPDMGGVGFMRERRRTG